MDFPFKVSNAIRGEKEIRVRIEHNVPPVLDFDISVEQAEEFISRLQATVVTAQELEEGYNHYEDDNVNGNLKEPDQG